MSSINFVQNSVSLQTPSQAKPAQKSEAIKLETKQTNIQKDHLEVQTHSKSPVMNVLGGSFAGLLVGGSVGGLGAGVADMVINNGYDLVGAFSFGARLGAGVGLLTGATVAQLTDTKTKAGVYGTLAGAIAGGAVGLIAERSLYAVSLGASFGAVTGGASSVAVSHFLGH
ncbi:hypothetical protein COW36_19020 [bacterium (Candidatus Blackallbacteria) CG17_big_fil_post_rev_8_21_14_2_50_48_46]|uniref:Uncharacterized protein n=1 Tax=bacterium (Candidatus Blackallbacteria) CG17_big_fil_post_rev_8_21_14_2_50_48_46 TaxID=2014261 RepID=A0A2M7G026_9BACT|nr:MAG: hypothetical protein COW64_25450 [bacterium (Candidatus Blackallbacteria) CG18_big_fil_WC_8_21_14_2_50_49_26]PIW15019.1 MAG: hypothetical protein COW36_19020 [bacterium (Candidatus Blackallbacteria) CG17_big_fil_post_rev_8_21_14_2_50_48_46]PIW44836.1 MAG: hypothetical protein COW20_22650 [bacterium (Candidatus Blackallbacteria) CG13_big_fil_rev_8_21_14_2_50_49_14]